MSRLFKKIPLWLTSALLVITPFLFLPFIEEKDAFRLPKEAFSLFMISLICGFHGVMIFEEGQGAVKSPWTRGRLWAILWRDKLSSTLLFFCLYLFLSSMLSSSPPISLRVSFNILLYTLLFLFLVSNISSGKERRMIRSSLVYPGVIMGLYSFFQYLGYDPVFIPAEPYMEKFLLTSGFIDNPNLFAGYLVALLPVTLAAAIAETKRGRRLLWGLSALILLTALILTNARTGLIAFLGGLLFFILLLNRWSIKRYVVTGVVLAALLSGTFIVTNKLYMAQSRRGLELPDKSLDVRLIHWKSAWLMISESPRSFLFGKGAGTFKLHYLDYRVKSVEGIKAPVRFENSHHAHNEYIQLWAESGSISIILTGMILIFFVKTLISLYSAREVAREKYIINSGYLASLVSVLINALASFPFHIAPSALAAVTVAALSISTIRGDSIETPFVETPSPGGEGRGEGKGEGARARVSPKSSDIYLSYEGRSDILGCL